MNKPFFLQTGVRLYIVQFWDEDTLRCGYLAGVTMTQPVWNEEFKVYEYTKEHPKAIESLDVSVDAVQHPERTSQVFKVLWSDVRKIWTWDKGSATHASNWNLILDNSKEGPFQIDTEAVKDGTNQTDEADDQPQVISEKE